jgi:hypothetical protein
VEKEQRVQGVQNFKERKGLPKAQRAQKLVQCVREEEKMGVEWAEV